MINFLKKFLKLNFYLSPPLDEDQLLEKASTYLQEWPLKGTSEDFRVLSKERGASFATAVFYQRWQEDPKQRPFRRFVQSNEEIRGHWDRVFIIVPALLYQSFPDVGADGVPLMKIIENQGGLAYQVPVLNVGHVEENVKILENFVEGIAEKHPDKKMVFIGLSKGAAEIFFYLEKIQTMEIFSRVEGIINYAGMLKGTYLAERVFKNVKTRLLGYINSLILGNDFSLFRETSSLHPMWQQDWTFLKHIKCVNVMACPLPYHIPNKLKGRYQYLSRYGPNDTLVILGDQSLNYGLTYLEWGAHHFMRTPFLSRRTKKIIDYFLHQY